MIIDPNILLRYILRDNAKQFKEAARIFESGEALHIDDGKYYLSWLEHEEISHS